MKTLQKTFITTFLFCVIDKLEKKKTFIILLRIIRGATARCGPWTPQ